MYKDLSFVLHIMLTVIAIKCYTVRFPVRSSDFHTCITCTSPMSYVSNLCLCQLGAGHTTGKGENIPNLLSL